MFIVRRIVLDDVGCVQGLCDSLFGFYLNVCDYLDDCLVLEVDGEIIGFAIVQDLGADEISLITHNYFDKPAKYLKVLGVKASKQNQHFGSIFFDYLFGCDSKTIICTAWENDGVIPIEALLNKYKFELIAEIKNYWFDVSLDKKDFCINCGSPCFCSCFIYKRDFKDCP